MPADRKQIAPWENYGTDVTSPCPNGAAVTPHDTNDLALVPRCLYIGTGGNVAVKMLDADGAEQTLTFYNVPSGSILPVCPSRVLTATTATNIIALW